MVGGYRRHGRDGGARGQKCGNASAAGHFTVKVDSRPDTQLLFTRQLSARAWTGNDKGPPVCTLRRFAWRGGDPFVARNALHVENLRHWPSSNTRSSACGGWLLKRRLTTFLALPACWFKRRRNIARNAPVHCGRNGRHGTPTCARHETTGTRTRCQYPGDTGEPWHFGHLADGGRRVPSQMPSVHGPSLGSIVRGM